jgi:ADP-ribosylglycohydrolase
MVTNIQLATLLEASLVADSLALPAHWVYSPTKIATDFGRISDLLSPPTDSYHAARGHGDQTHYGDQALLLWESLEATGGFDAADFMARWRVFWADTPAYRDGATRKTLENLAAGALPTEAGSSSSDFGGAARIAPLLVALREASDEAVCEAARAQTMLTHRDLAVGDAACFLVRATRAILRGETVSQALHHAAEAEYGSLPVKEHLAKAEAALPHGAVEAAAACGLACDVAQAFPATLALALLYPTDLENGLIENVMVGGDSAARGLALGMLLGAREGARVPERWLAIWNGPTITV